MTTSWSIKAVQLRTSIQLCTNLISLSHATKVCGDFSNSMLSASSGVQPREMKKAGIVLGVLETP